MFCEAKRTSPSILYIPHIQQWWDTAGSALRASFLSLLGSIPSFSPILLLATCSVPHQKLDTEVKFPLPLLSFLLFYAVSLSYYWKQETKPETLIPGKKMNILYLNISCFIIRYKLCFGRSMGRYIQWLFPPGRREQSFLRISFWTRRLNLCHLRIKEVCDTEHHVCVHGALFHSYADYCIPSIQ